MVVVQTTGVKRRDRHKAPSAVTRDVESGERRERTRSTEGYM